MQNEYIKHTKETVKDLNKSKWKLLVVYLLRKFPTLGEPYYKSRGVLDRSNFYNKPPFYHEFISRLQIVAFSKSNDHVTIPEAISEIKINISKYKWLYEKLSDQKSKDVLRNIILFRLTHNLFYIDLIKDLPEKQYFDTLLINHINKDVFIDVGACDGATSVAFNNLYKSEISKTILYEPDEDNFNVCKNNIIKNNVENAVVKKLCVGDSTNHLCFISGKGSGSKVSDCGSSTIMQTTLDIDLDFKSSYIKIDIEGYEMNAIKGARQHIINYKPSIAVCVYHYLSDIWQIPEELIKIMPDYNLYLRHYSNSGIETVLYAIPK